MKLTHILLPLLAIVILVSCKKDNNEQPILPDGTYKLGVPTDITFLLNIKDITTRATINSDTPLTIEGEKTVTDILIIVFDSEGIYEASAVNNNYYWEMLKREDEVVYDGTDTGSELVLNVKSGEKTMVSLANIVGCTDVNYIIEKWLRAAKLNPTVDGTLSSLKSLSIGGDSNSASSEWLDVWSIARVYDPSYDADNRFLMVSVNKGIHILPVAVDVKHRVTLDIQRVVAKYMVKIHSDDVLLLPDGDLTIPQGTGADNRDAGGFIIMHRAKGMYILPRENTHDPTYDSDAPIVGPTTRNMVSYEEYVDKIGGDGTDFHYKQIHLNNFKNPSNPAYQKSFTYVQENIDSNPNKAGTVTYGMVKMKFTPAQIVDGTQRVVGANSDGDFWVIGSSDGRSWYGSRYDDYYYKTEADAQSNTPEPSEVSAEIVYKPLKYTGGWCYYRMVFQDADGNSYTKRNSFYQVNITDITAIGSHHPSDLILADGAIPYNPASRLKIVVSVLAWNIELIDRGAN